MTERCDVAIVGAGLAGLSLAVRMAEDPRFQGRRVVLFDARPGYSEDRTWCRFDLEPHPFPECVVQSFHRLRVGLADGTRRVLHSRAAYTRIDALLLYRSARRRIAAAGFELKLGTAALAVGTCGAEGFVRVTNGEWRAHVVVDTRPRTGGCSLLVQRFTGLEVTVDGARFDPSTCDFMSNMRADSRGLNFMYVLPIAADRALVEDTWFARPGVALPDGRAAVDAYLREHLGAASYRILREEGGLLPMGLTGAGGSAGRVVSLGVAAGDLRAATGYAYDAIQRRIPALLDAIDGAIVRGRFTPSSTSAFGAGVAWMDRVFLNAARADPGALAAWMWALYARVPTSRLARFLHSGGSLLDRAFVAAALPTRPFLASVLADAGTAPTRSVAST